MTFQHFLLILWARKWLAALVLMVTVVTAIAFSLLMPKEYTATTSLVLDVQTPDRIMGMVLPGMMAPGYMATQMDIINSDRVARRVVGLLKLDQNPEIRTQWQEDTEGKGSIDVWLAPLLKRKLEVKPSRESSVINIEFSGAEPVAAAAIANAFATAYVETTIDLRAEPARKYAAWFEQQSQAQRARVERAQGALSEFQQRTGIVATDERMDFENQKLGELTAQLSMAQAEGTDSASKQNMKQKNDTLPEIMKNPLIIQLKTDIARLESKLKELSGDYGVNHPQYKNARSELDEMKARLQSETSKLTESISTQGRVSQARAAEIKLAIEAQKRKMLELNTQRDEINILSREVETAKRDFDAISQRLTQSQLEAQTVQTNVSVLTPAIAPLRPSKPILLLNLVVAILLGGMLALGAAVIAEMRNPIIRSRDDLAQALDLPVLAELEFVAVPLVEEGGVKTVQAKKSVSDRKGNSMLNKPQPLTSEV